jgi:flagellar biosynthesis chaperone FliJ
MASRARTALETVVFLREIADRDAAAELARLNAAVAAVERSRAEVQERVRNAVLPSSGTAASVRATMALRDDLRQLLRAADLTLAQTIAAREDARLAWAHARAARDGAAELVARRAAVVAAEQRRRQDRLDDDAAVMRRGSARH